MILQTIISVWAKVADGWIFIGAYPNLSAAMAAKRSALAEGFANVITKIDRIEPPRDLEARP